MRNLKNYVQNITKPIIRKNGFVTPQIIFDWSVIVGDYLAEFTTPLKITFPAQKNANGCLHIEVIGAQAPVVQSLEQEIIEKIAVYFGFKAITKIKLLHSRELPREKPVTAETTLTTVEAKKLDKMLASVEDAELKEKLKSIGKYVIRRQPG
jgi:hypothetical protein